MNDGSKRQRAPHGGGALLASFVVRVLDRRGQRSYQLHDLRSGRQHGFRQLLMLQRWLRAATLGRLR